jgi:hypothetical protein
VMHDRALSAPNRKERAEEAASLDRERSSPSYASARNEQLFRPEIESTNDDKETSLEPPRAS